MKKLISICLAVLFIFSSGTMALAQEDNLTPKPTILYATANTEDEYFSFTPPLTRIDQWGGFTFNFKTSLWSDYFYTTATSVRIVVQASGGGSFRATIIESGSSGWFPKQFVFSANDTLQSGTFTGLTNGAQYRIHFTKDGDNYVTGSGSLSNIRL